MPHFYRNVLTRTLQDVVDESLRQSNSEQLQLYEELALLRHNASAAIRDYGTASDLLDSALQSDDPSLREHAQELFREAANEMRARLKDVSEMAAQIATIEAKSANTITVFTLHGVVRQVVYCLYETLGPENMALAQEFEKMVKSDIVLPAAEVTGTTLTPDHDVSEMDNTIPSEESE